MRNYIKEADNKLINHIETGKQVSDQIFPITVKLKPKWIAGFLHKQKNSDIIKHRAYFNFKSDHDQMISDYIIDPSLESNYGDLIYTEDMKSPLYGKNYELENIDYSKLGNKVRDWVSVIYFNRTYYQDSPFPIDNSFEPSEVNYVIKKKYPAYYTYSFEDITKNDGYRRWYFIDGIPTPYNEVVENFSGKKRINEQLWMDDSQANLILYDSEQDGYRVNGVYNNYIYDLVSVFGPAPRLVSMKIDDTAKRFKIDVNSEYTYINAEREFESPIFFSQIFDIDWYRWRSEDYYPSTVGDGAASSGECFFGKLNLNGIRYPSSARFTSNKDMYSFYKQSGTIFKSNPRYQDETDDQSTIMYNIASKMLYRETFTHNSSQELHFVIKHYYGGVDTGELITDGIDVTGEANKRVTSTCLTEPYHVTEPMNKGEFINYVFVNETGVEPYEFGMDNMYMRLRTSYTLYKNMIKMIKSPKINDDVIQTITFFDTPESGLPDVPGDVYATFKNAIAGTIGYRRDHDVTDLVGGPVGVGKYYNFTIPTTDTRYSDGEMKVLGVSQFDWIEFNEVPIVRTGMKIYVGNYTQENCPLYNQSSPQPNEDVEFIDLSSYTEHTDTVDGDYTIDDGEKLYPMIKINGVQGYLKIIGIYDSNGPFAPNKTNTYIDFLVKIEVPYCAGANDLRVYPDNIDPIKKGLNWKSTYLLKTNGYIKAGSQEVIDNKKEVYNKRFVPEDSDFITKYMVLSNISEKTPRVINKDSNKTFNYPPYHVWWNNYQTWPNIQRPADNDYWNHGSINLSLQAPYEKKRHKNDPYDYVPTQYYRSPYDAKIMFHVNNQRWKFGDKNLSYIGRENPQFIYEMDANTLLNDYTKDQVKNYGIPDNKQFFYVTAKGNAEASAPDNSLTPFYAPQEDTGDNPLDILANMKSDLKLEVWDLNTNRWQKIINTSYSSYKRKKVNIISDLYIMSDTPETPIDNVLTSPSNFYKLYIGYYNQTELVLSMPEVGLELGNLENGNNLVLYNKKIDKSYHIASIDTATYLPFGTDENVLVVTVQDDEDGTLLDPASGAIVNVINDLGSEESILSINTPYQIKSGIPDYEFKSRYSRASFFETLSLSVLNGNIINSEGKVYIRFSLERDADYRMNDSSIQYIGSGVGKSSSTELERSYSNFPWGDGTTFDSTFDYKKIGIKEVIRRLNAHYISLNNVY